MSQSAEQFRKPVTFLPAIEVEDPLAAHWLAQVTYSLRREIAWLWQLRGMSGLELPHALPPFEDRVVEALDFSRYWEERERFFREDEACQYLSSQLEKAPPEPAASSLERGSFSWLARELDLSDAACLALALVLHPMVDSGTTAVISSCLNDPTQSLPNLALAQRLWNDPTEFLDLLDLQHPLFRYAVIIAKGNGSDETLTWQSSLSCSPPISRCLLNPRSVRDNSGLATINLNKTTVSIPTQQRERLQPVLRLDPDQRRIIPIRAAHVEDGAQLATELSREAGRSTSWRKDLSSDTLAWLQGVDLVCELRDPSNPEDVSLPQVSLPVNVWLILPVEGPLPASHAMMAPVEIARPDFNQRLEQWRCLLEGKISARTAQTLPDIARRYRLDYATIASIAEQLTQLDRPISEMDLDMACQETLSLDLGGCATKVAPRFRMEELALPQTQQNQIEDIIGAIASLTRVHYDWGTARAWNEAGLSALFTGPPGTGKSMTAEVIAAESGLPFYRVDLSQVVNKYIGETEKNLRRIFDTADNSDICILFDEADALFGKRSEVRDAHDRFANIEISYLLQRMEAFRGVAILTTNRKKDLDEAFLRRLNFVVDFPMPGIEERHRLWEYMLPPNVKHDSLDLPFLSTFPLAGGHIRSIIFAACLKEAHDTERRELTMPVVLHALKREYDKLERALPTGQPGPYRAIFESFLDESKP